MIMSASQGIGSIDSFDCMLFFLYAMLLPFCYFHQLRQCKKQQTMHKVRIDRFIMAVKIQAHYKQGGIDTFVIME